MTRNVCFLLCLAFCFACGDDDRPGVDAGPTDTGTDATGTSDTGTSDAGEPDTGVDDTGTSDAGEPDTGVDDTGVGDTGTADSGVDDSGVDDTGTADTGMDDTGVDGGPADVGSDIGAMDAGSACNSLGEMCSSGGTCSGAECLEGRNVCVPTTSFECGGFVGAACPGERPVCLYPSGSSAGICMTPAQRACVCSTDTGRTTFPGCAG